MPSWDSDENTRTTPGKSSGTAACSQAAYPAYILHQTVIVVIGFYVVQWNGLAELGAGLQFAVIAVTATVATVLIYDLLVKRTNMTRFLFGMKPLKKGAPVPQLADRLRGKSPG